MGGAFAGLKVADFSWVIVAPAIGKYLAIQGAQVVRVESIHAIDALRVSAPYKDNVPGINRAGLFPDYNTNKYGIALNLNHREGLKVAQKLVAWADVVLESFTPGVMSQWGLGYDDLRKINPDIIMLSSTNQGQTGPCAHLPGFGVQLVGLTGFVQATGWPDRIPSGPYGAYTDYVACRLGAAALIAALDYRRRTGKGTYLDLSQFEASINFLSPWVLDYSANGHELARVGNRSPCASPHGAYRCRGDDRWCAISVFTDEEWKRMGLVMGNPAWANDDKFQSFVLRKENEDELDKLIEAWTINYQAEEVMARLQAAGIAAGIVENARDLFDDPQLRHRQHFRFAVHSEMGTAMCNMPGFRLSKSPAEIAWAGPCLGEHTEYVCTKFLGMSDSEFVRLLESGVFE